MRSPFCRKTNAGKVERTRPVREEADMNCRTRAALFCGTAIFIAVSFCIPLRAQMASFTKGQVADRIRKVEDGVDEFRKYLDNRGEDAKSRAESAQDSGATTRRQRGDSKSTGARRDQA